MDQDVDKLDHLDRIRRHALLHRAKGADARDSKARPERDLAATLELLKQTAEAIRRVEERAQQTEARSELLLRRATEELKAAEARIEAAETRARAAEARVQEVEDWLDRVHDIVTQEILSVGRHDKAGAQEGTASAQEERTLAVAAGRAR